MSVTSFTPLVVPRLGDDPVDLRDEADRARARGYAEGYAEGRRAAREEAERQRVADREQALRRAEEHQRTLTSALSSLHAAGKALGAQVDRVTELSADRIEELALGLAGTILEAELSDPARSAAHALRRALAHAPHRAWYRILLSERDGTTLRADERSAAQLRGIEVEVSAAVDPGGAVLELENGEVDVRILAALTRAADALRGDGGRDRRTAEQDAGDDRSGGEVIR